MTESSDDALSPSKTPFLNNVSDLSGGDGGPSSPFHEMVDSEDREGNNTNSDTMTIENSPSRKLFLDGVQDDGSVAGHGQSSPYHSMQGEENQVEGIGIELSPSKANLQVHKGYADFDDESVASIATAIEKKRKWTFEKKRRIAVKMMYMSIFASMGALLRVIMAQFFGEECKNPGTVGWLKAGQPLCVTRDGETTLEGGIIFADLPANLLGSFIMGLMQPTDVLGLPKSFSVAWLGEDNPFQTWDIIHLAIKTGFCGSLTTYSSWNSEMVVMMMGEGLDTGSLLFRGLFGYFIGVETALASFILGKNIASYLHSYINPVLQREAEQNKTMKERGVYINTELPDFERRFLPGYNMGEYSTYIDPSAEEYLSKWKFSTEEARKVGNDLLPLLTDIEYRALTLGEMPDEDLAMAGQEIGWDIVSLEQWVILRKELKFESPPLTDSEFRFFPSFVLFSAMVTLLSIGVALFNHDDSYAITYRTMMYAALFAPFGALSRWQLSKLNGRLRGSYSWLPIGTFTANLLASIISACMVGVEFKFMDAVGFWKLGTARAIKIGFAGCLSTVSTFVAEISSFLNSSYPVRGYFYIFFSLSITCAFATLCFWLVTIDGNIENDDYN